MKQARFGFSDHKKKTITKTYVESNENSYIHELVHICIVMLVLIGWLVICFGWLGFVVGVKVRFC